MRIRYKKHDSCNARNDNGRAHVFRNKKNHRCRDHGSSHDNGYPFQGSDLLSHNTDHACKQQDQCDLYNLCRLQGNTCNLDPASCTVCFISERCLYQYNKYKRYQIRRQCKTTPYMIVNDTDKQHHDKSQHSCHCLFFQIIRTIAKIQCCFIGAGGI